MKLFEIFDKIAHYEWVAEDDNIGEAEFNISGYEYTILFEKVLATHLLPEHWTIEFAQQIPNKRGYKSPSVEFTRTGHSFEVMGTVKAIILDWFDKHPTKCIVVSAATPSRQKLYRDMIKQVFPTWDIDTYGHIIVANSPDQ
jgi:hypothetical protein